MHDYHSFEDKSMNQNRELLQLESVHLFRSSPLPQHVAPLDLPRFNSAPHNSSLDVFTIQPRRRLANEIRRAQYGGDIAPQLDEDPHKDTTSQPNIST